ncbi:MAG: biopolymer transporter ExbD [Fibrobacterota bacterium]
MSMSFRASRFGSAEGGAPQVFRPQMTSLIDILTLLLIFLIQSFSAEGNLITPSDDLQLPVSSAKEAPKPMLMIEITSKAVMSEGTVLASADSVEHSAALSIEPLYQWLLQKKKTVADTTKNLEVIIQCDREMPFKVVKKVMFTCSRAGYADFSVLAVQKD